MSLYDVRERTKRVAGWLREDREKMEHVRDRMNEALSLPIDSDSPKQHEYLLVTFKSVLNIYADIVAISANLNVQVAKSVMLLSEAEKAVEKGYIDAVPES